MPIHEESFRIGCGRYVQGKGYINKLPEEIFRLGSRPLIIGDDTTLSLTRDNILKELSSTSIIPQFYLHNGSCNHTGAKSIADFSKEKGCDVIIGVGGGVLMDIAKLSAFYAALPVINVPTSSATCAAYAPLSVCYTQEGRTIGTKHYENEVNCVIVDTEILIGQPVNLFLAGVFDALAKFVEIKHRYKESNESYPMGLDYAYVMAKRSFDLLTAKTAKCIADMEAGDVSYDFENVIFTTIAATGVISGIARGSNQTALAHKFYEMTRLLFPESSRPYLHGEIVGVGLLLQNHYNGEESSNDHLISLMKSHAMPYRPSDVGADVSETSFDEYYTRICNSSAIDKNDTAMCEKFKESLKYFWNIQ